MADFSPELREKLDELEKELEVRRSFTGASPRPALASSDGQLLIDTPVTLSYVC